MVGITTQPNRPHLVITLTSDSQQENGTNPGRGNGSNVLLIPIRFDRPVSPGRVGGVGRLCADRS